MLLRIPAEVAEHRTNRHVRTTCQSTDPELRSGQIAAESGPTRDGEAADRLSLNLPTRSAKSFTATERTAAAPPIQSWHDSGPAAGAVCLVAVVKGSDPGGDEDQQCRDFGKQHRPRRDRSFAVIAKRADEPFANKPGQHERQSDQASSTTRGRPTTSVSRPPGCQRWIGPSSTRARGFLELGEPIAGERVAGPGGVWEVWGWPATPEHVAQLGGDLRPCHACIPIGR
jgi:hypothetical protein